MPLSATVPRPGGPRADVEGHSCRPKPVGLQTRQYTGWLEVDEDGKALCAPHTEPAYKAPTNNTLRLPLDGALAKRGVRTASKAATARA